MNLRLLYSKSAIYTSLFILALGILLTIGAIAYHELTALRASEKLVRHSQDVHLTLEQLFSALKDSESGQRGFLISRDSIYLNNYTQSKPIIEATLDSLAHLTIDNAEQQILLSELKNLIGLRLQTMENTLSLAGQVKSDSALNKRMLSGLHQMETIRDRINIMVDNESDLFAERKLKYQADVQFVPVVYITAILFALLVFAFSFYKISRDQVADKIASGNLQKAIKELEFQNTIFAHAEEAANVGNFIWKENTGEIICSENLIRLLDYEPRGFSHAPLELVNHIHPEDREDVKAYVQEIIETKKVNRKVFRVITGKDEIKYFRTSGNYLMEENKPIWIGNLQDVTSDVLLNEKLRLSKSELVKSEIRHHQMVSEVEDYAIIFLNKDGIVERWNRGAEKIKGYMESEILGQSFSVFYSEDDRTRQLPQHLLGLAREHGRVTHQGWRVRKDGSKFWGSVVITAMHDELNNVIGFTKVTRDLTAQKQSEDDQIKYQRSIEKKNAELEKINTELASFNHVASHDLQEPLRKIQTFISRITEDQQIDISPLGKEYFSRIRNSANRMQHLIDDLITYSHSSRRDQAFVKIELNRILQNVLQELGPRIEEAHVEIVSEDLPVILGIPFQLEQLFTNIIDNSIKYRKQDQPLHISITYTPVTGKEIPVDPKSDATRYHKISFTDNGIGFENQYSETIFTLFQRLHGKSEYSGTGIGLAICKRIMDNHSGLITAEGKPMVGSVFNLFFPT